VRKTFDLDDDVATLLEKVRKGTGASFREVVNTALRDGLERMLEPTPFRTKVHSPGQCYLPNLDNTAEILAATETDHNFL